MSRMLTTASLFTGLTRRIAADRRGVSAVITAIALTALAGFCGLAVDVVMWEVNERNMQGVADQSALAAATAYRNAGETGALGDSTTAQNAAYATAIRNGYAAGSLSVAAYNDGKTCTHDGCLQVTITQQQPQFFTAMFSNGVTANASAVGTCNGCAGGSLTLVNNGGNPCVMALDASGKGVVTDTGGAILSLSACNLYNNSPQTDATVVNNNGVIEGCTTTNACGSMAFLAQPNNPGGIDVPVVTGAAPAADPFGDITAPTIASSCQQFPNPPTNIPSGTYCPGILDNANVSFADGAIIVLDGPKGLSTQGNSTLSGNGVMLYVLNGGTINANSTMNISAPTSGPYAGIALWFGDSSGVSYAGGNGAGFSGAIYAPTSNVNWSGNQASNSTCTRLIAASIDLSGGAASVFDNTGCPLLAGPILTSSGVPGGTTYNGAPMLVQ
jgi:Flp pilus assembly protein TadG